MAARNSINSRSQKLALLLLHLAAILLFANSSNAQNVDQNAINQQDWITRQQQNKIEEDRRLREQATIRKDRLRKKKEADEEGKTEAPISGKPAECFPIKSIAKNIPTL